MSDGSRLSKRTLTERFIRSRLLPITLLQRLGPSLQRSIAMVHPPGKILNQRQGNASEASC